MLFSCGKSLTMLVLLTLVLGEILFVEAKTRTKGKKGANKRHHKNHHKRHQNKPARGDLEAKLAASAVDNQLIELSKSQLKHQEPQTERERERDREQVVEADKSVYPDYCWFDGLENRILVEYPTLYSLVKAHDEKLRAEHDSAGAAEMHKEIFMKIYQFELEKLSSEEAARRALKEAAKGAKGRRNLRPASASSGVIDSPEKRAAYKLFDLWANTPGDFERKHDEYSNYLEPYLIRTQIEFWSYCLDDRAGCSEVLNQLSVLAREHELGPVELLQVSLNIIMLMNSYKADLLLEKLIERNVIRLDELHVKAGQHLEQVDEEAKYNQVLSYVVDLIETDEDFNEASFHYTFTKTHKIDKFIDPKIESFFADKIANFAQVGKDLDSNSNSNSHSNSNLNLELNNDEPTSNQRNKVT